MPAPDTWMASAAATPGLRSTWAGGDFLGAGSGRVNREGNAAAFPGAKPVKPERKLASALPPRLLAASAPRRGAQLLLRRI